MKPAQTIHLDLPTIPMALFASLWGRGIGIRARMGTSLEALLCDQLGIDPDYLENRIQTILVNTRAVDEVAQLHIREGDVIALSAAMPGLAGTTLRKGGHLAAMREEISHKNDVPSPADEQAGIVTLKLFNMVAREIGPQILSQGIWLSGRDAADLVAKNAMTPKLVVTAESTEWVELSISSPA